MVTAALAAATDPDPAIRYTVGTERPILPPILQSLQPLQHLGLLLTGQV